VGGSNERPINEKLVKWLGGEIWR